MQLVAGGIKQSPIMIMITHRPEWQPPFVGLEHVTSLQLNRLGKAQGAEIVRAIAGDYVQDDVIERIVSRTDGIPLFVEELTKSLVEGGLDIAEADIPATLHASLLARLDRLGNEAKEMAQIGSVIGRDFDHKLLASVVDKDDAELDTVLSHLVTSELVFRTGVPPEAVYNSRQDIHRRIATALIDLESSDAGRKAQVVAHHLEAAEDYPNAARYWFEAGNEAYDLYANHEALAHYERAIGLIENLPNAEDYAELDLDCQIARGTVGLLVKGPADPALLEANTKAARLCDIVGDDRRSFKLTWGRWFLQHFGAQDPIEAVKTADHLLDIGQRMNDRGMLLQGHHSAWTTYWTREELLHALEHAQAGIRLYDVEQHSHQHADFGGHDAGMCANGTCGMVNGLLGNLDQSIAYAKQAVELSQEVGHFYSEVFARGFGTTPFMMRRELEPLLVWIDDFGTIVGDYGGGYGAHIVTPNIIKGWALIVEGQDNGGLALLESNLVALRKSGFPKINFHLMLMADAQRVLGNVDSALQLINEAQENAEAVHERIWLAEIARTRGNILLASGEADAALTSFERALELAKNQDTRLFRLRAARDEALNHLSPSYAQFTEGFDTPDLIEAKALLEELN
jgi:tetratricopeptide (TPR) repeat protein